MNLVTQNHIVPFSWRARLTSPQNLSKPGPWQDAPAKASAPASCASWQAASALTAQQMRRPRHTPQSALHLGTALLHASKLCLLGWCERPSQGDLCFLIVSGRAGHHSSLALLQIPRRIAWAHQAHHKPHHVGSARRILVSQVMG